MASSWTYQILGSDTWRELPGKHANGARAAEAAAELLAEQVQVPAGLVLEVRRSDGHVAQYAVRRAYVATRRPRPRGKRAFVPNPVSRNEVFGALKALEPHRSLRAGKTWLCFCLACGRIQDRLGTHLRGGHRTGCKWCGARKAPSREQRANPPEPERLERFRAEVAEVAQGKSIREVQG